MLEIKDLKDFPEYIDEVSTLLWRQWQEPNNGLSLDDTIKRTKNIYKANNACPSMLIALDNKILAWTASLWISDIPERQDLFPFLASLYVKNDYRQRWIAKSLVAEIEKLALLNWWKKLYLFDDSNIEWFYEKLWFSFYEEDTYKWYTYKIYKKELWKN